MDYVRYQKVKKLVQKRGILWKTENTSFSILAEKAFISLDENEKIDNIEEDLYDRYTFYENLILVKIALRPIKNNKRRCAKNREEQRLRLQDAQYLHG